MQVTSLTGPGVLPRLTWKEHSGACRPTMWNIYIFFLYRYIHISPAHWFDVSCLLGRASEAHPSDNSVKRSDVTRWKHGYITPSPPHLICQFHFNQRPCHQRHFVSNDFFKPICPHLCLQRGDIMNIIKISRWKVLFSVTWRMEIIMMILRCLWKWKG